MKSRRGMCLCKCLCTLVRTSTQIEKELNMNVIYPRNSHTQNFFSCIAISSPYQLFICIICTNML